MRENNYAHLVSMAINYIGLAYKDYQDGNEWAYRQVLLGNGIILRSPDGSHNYQAAVDGFHEYYRKHPDSDIELDFLSTLKMSFDYVTSFEEFDKIVKIFFYELYLEKNNKNAFTVNKRLLVETINRTLQSRQKYLRGDVALCGWLATTPSYAKEKYGIDIIDKL